MPCNKVAYLTRAEARTRQKNSKHAKMAASHKQGKSSAMRPYHCKWCLMWHLGHRPKNREKGFK